MALRRKYIDKDVLTAAKERIHHLFDTHDTVAVCFSGGKDSLVVLHLVKEVAEERGEKMVNVVFRDEELIPDSVIEFVDSYRAQPWVNMLYFAVPLKSTKFILGRTFDYVQWDPNREHVRPMPEHAIRMPAGETRVFDQYSMDAFTADLLAKTGRVALLTGVRAAESLFRLHAALSKLHDNYIHQSESRRVNLAQPIYDWEEDDVFRYFFDRQIRYCQLYDHQAMAGMNLRVSTPLHAESAKRIGRLREVDPGFYNRILKVFPEMELQDRYYAELDTTGLMKRYGQSLEGVRTYIMEKYTGDAGQRDLALQRWEEIKRSNQPYPPEYVLGYFIGGAIKRALMPKYK